MEEVITYHFTLSSIFICFSRISYYFCIMVQNVFGDDVAMRCLVNRGRVVCPVRVCADRVIDSLVFNCI